MKNKLLFALMIISLACHAQTDSTEIKLNHYKKLFMDGTITSQEYETLRKQVLGIEVKPQEVKIVEVEKIPDTLTYEQQVEANRLYRQGQSDANKYFKTGGPLGGTFAATIFGSPLLGLIPAIACSSSPPKEINFTNENPQLFKNADYLRGYRVEATRKKKAHAWTGWGAGFALDAMIATVAALVTRKDKR